jgi:hypothetical protein
MTRDVVLGEAERLLEVADAEFAREQGDDAEARLVT